MNWREYIKTTLTTKPAITAFVAVLFVASIAAAGSLTPSASPAATMHSVGNIYDVIASAGYDSSAVSSDANGSLFGMLKYINDTMPAVGVSSNAIDFDEIVASATFDSNWDIASAGYAFNFDNGAFYIGDYVGIASASPSAVLSVEGNMRLDGEVAAGNIAVIGGSTILSTVTSETPYAYSNFERTITDETLFDTYDNATGFNNVLELNPGGDASGGTITGLSNIVYTPNTNTADNTGFTITGLRSYVEYGGTGGVDGLIGAHIRAQTTTGAGALDGGDFIGLLAETGISGAGVNGDVIGVRVTPNGSVNGTSFGVIIDAGSISTNSYGLYIYDHAGKSDGGAEFNIYSGGTGANYFGGNTSVSSNLEVAGYASTSKLYVGLTGTQTTNAVCHPDNGQTTGQELVDCDPTAGDYMEMYPMETSVEEGEIVVLDPDMLNSVLDKDGNRIPRLVRSIKAYQNEIMGITSIGSQSSDFNTIGRNLRPEDNPKPLALAGRVLLKVSTVNGAIKAGDRITSSDVPGIGMKATGAGMTVGIALEPLDAPASGSYEKIMVFVKPQYWAPDVVSVAGEPILDQHGSLFQSLFAVIVNAFRDVFGIQFGEKRICLGDTCLNESQLKELLQRSRISAPADTPEPTLTETPMTTPESTGSQTPSPLITPEPTETPEPSVSLTPESTETPEPSVSATPAPTLIPSKAPEPTETPTPTPDPTESLAPTPAE